MRKPHAIIDLLSDHSQVVIDLFEIADLTACTDNIRKIFKEY